MTTIALGIGGGVLLLLLVAAAVASRIRVAGPNQAFLITGRRDRSSAGALLVADENPVRVVTGASVFVVPVLQKLHVLELSSRRLPVAIRAAVSANGIKCDLDGVAIVKVGGTAEAIRAAAQRFLGQQDGIEVFTSEVLAGSLRAIVGRLTVEEIIKDRAAFASAVAEEAEASLTNQGLALDTFQLQDIQAEGNYLMDLGRPEAARVAKEAAIAEARAGQVAEQERLLAAEATAVAARTLSLKQAEIKAETDAATARAAAAGPLARAARDQEVLAAQEKVAERTAALKERELDTEIRKPADAWRYQVEQESEAARNAAVLKADGARQATVADAQARAEEARLLGEAERTRRSALAEAEAIEGAKRGEAERARRSAIASAVRSEGEAEAAAIAARGRSEAEALEARAEAFRQFGEAALADMLVKVLPDVVREASAPLAAVDRLTIIGADGANSLPRTVANTVEQGLQLTSDLAGIDLRALLAGLAGQNGRPHA